MKAFIRRSLSAMAVVMSGIALSLSVAQHAEAAQPKLSKAQQAALARAQAEDVEIDRLKEVFLAAFELDDLVNAGELTPAQSTEILQDLDHVDFNIEINFSALDTPKMKVEKIMNALNVKRLTAIYLAVRSGLL